MTHDRVERPQEVAFPQLRLPTLRAAVLCQCLDLPTLFLVLRP
jgi:hypothetical protein